MRRKWIPGGKYKVTKDPGTGRGVACVLVVVVAVAVDELVLWDSWSQQREGE